MNRSPQSPREERTAWSPALIGFYVGCAMVSIGAAVAASAWIVFGTPTLVAAGLVMVTVGTFACLRCLRAARQE